MADVKDLEPYSSNSEGLTAVLQDLKSTMPDQIVFKVTGYNTTAFENVTQGDALYSRASDGQVGKAIAKVLGIQKGALYDLLTSRLVGAALGAVLGERL